MTDIPAKTRAPFGARFWNSPALLLTLTALMFAGHSVVGRLALGQISPMTLTCARWGLALAPLSLAARANFSRDWAILRPRWIFIIAMGALGFTAFNAMFYTAAHHTSALNLSIIQGAIPAFVLIGARLIFGVRVGPWQAFGAFITMVGVAAIASQGDLAKLLGAGLQQRRPDHVARQHFLRRLYRRPARAPASLRPRLFHCDGGGRFRHLDPAARAGDRQRRFHLADPEGPRASGSMRRCFPR